ncbi:hypothetical protein CRG98_010006 [Punica granatum]|uniref:Uncharacterized protein n=1 Tax=Punica granatum TaxID=22663 RepID=A0A2I0KMT1_PUNGR|nr:hypothetical protein CRG98_010006 [Punica granatum]
MHRVRQGFVHGQGGGVLTRRGMMRSVVLKEALGYSKRRGSALRPRLALPWKKGEDRRWSTREGGLDSLVVRGGWSGRTRSLVTARIVVRGTVPPRDGSSRIKGVNSLKSSRALWGPIRWQTRLEPFPYSESLSNPSFLLVACGISSEVPRNR